LVIAVDIDERCEIDAFAILDAFGFVGALVCGDLGRFLMRAGVDAGKVQAHFPVKVDIVDPRHGISPLAGCLRKNGLAIGSSVGSGGRPFAVESMRVAPVADSTQIQGRHALFDPIERESARRFIAGDLLKSCPRAVDSS
jgi:hypothetical protein